MNDYIIFTDSACDLPDTMLTDLGVKYRSLTFAFEGEAEHGDREMSAKDFYARMRSGGIAKTSAINTESFRAVFEDEIAAGNDILYIAFSSGLSTTYNSGRFALENLKDKYPDRKLIAVDSLCASAGFGLLVYLAAKKKQVDPPLISSSSSSLPLYVFDPTKHTSRVSDQIPHFDYTCIQNNHSKEEKTNSPPDDLYKIVLNRILVKQEHERNALQMELFHLISQYASPSNGHQPIRTKEQIQLIHQQIKNRSRCSEVCISSDGQLSSPMNTRWLKDKMTSMRE